MCKAVNELFADEIKEMKETMATIIADKDSQIADMGLLIADKDLEIAQLRAQNEQLRAAAKIN